MPKTRSPAFLPGCPSPSVTRCPRRLLKLARIPVLPTSERTRLENSAGSITPVNSWTNTPCLCGPLLRAVVNSISTSLSLSLSLSLSPPLFLSIPQRTVRCTALSDQKSSDKCRCFLLSSLHDELGISRESAKRKRGREKDKSIHLVIKDECTRCISRQR